MTERGAYTLAEITSQPSVWADALKEFGRQSNTLKKLWQDHHFNHVIFTGCGSTYYLSLVGAALFQTLTGIAVHARPASEIVLFPELSLIPGANSLLIAVSRSGETTETIEAAQLFKAQTGNPVVVITCYGESVLARQADFILAASAAQEQSVTQTRSFSSMTVLVEALAASLAGQDDNQLTALIPFGERLLADYQALARQLGEAQELDRFFFLGSGLQYGIACEAMLKMKEMSLSYSEAYHTLEFRHGPMSMVDERTLVVGLISEGACQQEAAVLEQMRNQGAQTLALYENDDHLNLSKWSRVVRLQSGLPAWARPVLYLPVLQLMAYYRAMVRGQNPDRPANLEAVVSLKRLRA
jgi:glucosamine--fructose-6-phosphate aminotransferase (isomerizing)